MGILGKKYIEHTRKYGFNKISNLDELKVSQQRLHKDLKKKELDMEVYYDSIKQLLNPVTYINEFLANVFTLDNITDYFVKGYNFARNLIYKFRCKQDDNFTD